MTYLFAATAFSAIGVLYFAYLAIRDGRRAMRELNAASDCYLNTLAKERDSKEHLQQTLSRADEEIRKLEKVIDNWQDNTTQTKT